MFRGRRRLVARIAVRPCRLIVVVALFATIVGAPSAAAGDDAPADRSVGPPPACGDVSVASLMAAECFAGAEPLPEDAAASGASAESALIQAAAGEPPLATAAPSSFAASCRYDANVIFYAQNEWITVGRTLAAHASPCAEYWIHVPTLAANKLACRVNQAHQIRAFGPRFHAMCEAHLAGWQAWVNADPSRTWYDAGVALRAQMASVGFDVALGDTWSVNEFTSAIRRGDGNARTNALAFLRGLYEGGELPDTKGNVFVIGLAHGTVPTTVYKDTLKRWFGDADFWREASKYVRFWGQEVFGDVRNTLVPGEPRARRAESLSDYLHQVGMLAADGPDEVGVARSFLRDAHFPLANAAWAWPSAFGFTAVPVETMKHFVGIQEHAIRHYLGSNPHRVAPTIGYAWQIRNHFGTPAAEFRAEWTGLLEQLAAAIADSLGSGGSSQMGACGPSGEHIWCGGEYESAMFNPEWARLRTWE
jgi:hypothetical protein